MQLDYVQPIVEIGSKTRLRNERRQIGIAGRHDTGIRHKLLRSPNPAIAPILQKAQQFALHR